MTTGYESHRIIEDGTRWKSFQPRSYAWEAARWAVRAYAQLSLHHRTASVSRARRPRCRAELTVLGYLTISLGHWFELGINACLLKASMVTWESAAK